MKSFLTDIQTLTNKIPFLQYGILDAYTSTRVEMIKLAGKANNDKHYSFSRFRIMNTETRKHLKAVNSGSNPGNFSEICANFTDCKVSWSDLANSVAGRGTSETFSNTDISKMI